MKIINLRFLRIQITFGLNFNISTSEPSSKDSESEKLEERQNSPDSEDTQENIILVEKQNSPTKWKGKEKVFETPKDTPFVTIISDPTQPPANTIEFDVWRFRTAVNEQATLVERLKKKFELKNTELQTLSAFGPPTDDDSEAVKSERNRINALTLRIDSFLSASLNNLVDTPVYLFDTTEKDWSKIA
ncbi:hypothetical protein L1887_32301 [Cichorium endivia]|nr:hypothetical protein L1887_32301 [Cichorium endivia]